MKKRTPISKIMTTSLVTIPVTEKLENAEKLFKKYHIRHIPVVKEKEVIGMLSYSDILKISFPDTNEETNKVETFVYDMFSIEQIMAKNLYSVPPYATIKEVSELLSDKEFHALPVVEDEELVGIVTTTDLTKYLVEQL